jgi:hypothetical protein
LRTGTGIWRITLDAFSVNGFFGSGPGALAQGAILFPNPHLLYRWVGLGSIRVIALTFPKSLVQKTVCANHEPVFSLPQTALARRAD